MSLNARSHIMLVCIIFLLSVIYFVYNGSWYAPAVLEIKGTVSSLPAGFDVAWDSGSGFNPYETYKAPIKFPVNTQTEEQTIEIRYLGKRNGASLGKRVFIDGIWADGREITDSRLQLNEEQPKQTYQVGAEEQISIRLLTNNYSGHVGIEVNGVYLEKDLYVANIEAKNKTYDFWLVSDKNEFTVRADLPRYPIKNFALVKRKDGKSIKLSSIILITNGARVSLLDQPQYLTKASFNGISDYQKRYFDWGRFCQQLLFGALTAWLFSALLRLYLGCEGLRGCLSGQKRVFFALFCGAFTCYLIWLLIFWPGVFSVDSLKIWRAAQLPKVFLNDHPILNVFFYTYLYHIWNNPAIVPLVHIVLMSVLVAWIFYTIHLHGVSWSVIVPFYLFTILSIPIGLYNLMLWKDVPFAMLILFWAFISPLIYSKKRSGTLNFTAEQIIALVLMLLALGFVRHNGLLYVVFIPLLYLLLGVIRLSRKFWLGLAGFALFTVFILVLITTTKVSDAGYLIAQGTVYLKSMLQSSPMELLHRTWDNYWGILDINQTVSKWDLFHYYLNDRYSYSFLQHAGWHDVYPFQQRWVGPLAFLREPALALYQASYSMPFVYLSWNPVWALVLFPVCLLVFRWLPLSAVFSSIILIQIVALAGLLNVLNWRYYYFVCLAACFIVPVICFDIKRTGSRQQ